MSIFDNNDKDAMYEEIIEFLQNHTLYELFYIISAVLKHNQDLYSKQDKEEESE